MRSEQLYQEDVNTRSLVHARGWTALMNGFSDGAKLEPLDMLPFETKGNGKRQLSKDTKAVLRGLKDRNVLPPVFWGAIGHLLDEINAV